MEVLAGTIFFGLGYLYKSVWYDNIVMSTKTILNCPHMPTIVRDQFAQCDSCHLWMRLWDKDQYGKRTLPLHWMDSDEWYCEGCYDRIEGTYENMVPAEIVR